SDETNVHFFPNVSENCLLYTGTHDNDTSEGWWASAGESTKEFALKYLPQREKISQSMIEAALGSVADTVIVPMQDVLGLGSEARMNIPGTVGGRNWQWRMEMDALSHVNTDSLREMNEFFDRTPRGVERF
ncbi:MAG: 4-alpha-glucanotransferase, partial [Clostridia bacterium]|nr:4-alpha-glucanotransferase [Clostridia bacterium]